MLTLVLSSLSCSTERGVTIKPSNLRNIYGRTVSQFTVARASGAEMRKRWQLSRQIRLSMSVSVWCGEVVLVWRDCGPWCGEIVGPDVERLWALVCSVF